MARAHNYRRYDQSAKGKARHRRYWATAKYVTVRARASFRSITQGFQRQRRDFLWWLKDVPCGDCGGRFHPAAMDFDHVTGEKVASLCHGTMWSWERLATEVLKCEIVCANCHRVRTFKRRQHITSTRRRTVAESSLEVVGSQP